MMPTLLLEGLKDVQYSQATADRGHVDIVLDGHSFEGADYVATLITWWILASIESRAGRLKSGTVGVRVPRGELGAVGPLLVVPPRITGDPSQPHADLLLRRQAAHSQLCNPVPHLFPRTIKLKASEHSLIIPPTTLIATLVRKLPPWRHHHRSCRFFSTLLSQSHSHTIQGYIQPIHCLQFSRI